ncbi:MAG: hypothetical protein WAW37_04695 [Syntrophobacteraceae bacterium]
MLKMKWFIYTVLLGLSPALARIVISLLMSGHQNLQWFNEADLVTYGLVLTITNINLVEHKHQVDPNWKTLQVGVSLLLLIFFVTIFAVSCITEADPSLFSRHNIKLASFIAALSATLLNYSVVDRISKLDLLGMANDG